ncbi:MAG: redoxin family protein [Phycisphaerales bacterium]
MTRLVASASRDSIRFGALSATAALLLSAGAILAQESRPSQDQKQKQEAKPEPKQAGKEKEKKPAGVLKKGAPAPELSIEKWVKGDEVKGFEKGTVYVVEFWATWCPPCVKSIPHLSQLQKDNPQVVFIGVAGSERGDTSDDKLRTVQSFVSKQGSKMDYRVAFDADRSMSKTWMEPANQTGIPAAFIVDHEGKIAWIGHPMSMDKALAAAVKKAPAPRAQAFPTFEPASIVPGYQEAKQDGAKKEAKSPPAGDELTLYPGLKAPAMQVGKFVKGEPVTSFEKGRVYVVEFWATWCGPCIKAIPHLTDLAQEYAGKATFVGVSVWENDQAKVEPFVTKQGDRMGYTVAYDQVSAFPEGVTAGTRAAQMHAFEHGKMSQTWMKAAGRDGIPSSFIVDKNGMIAWIGSPFEIDENLKQVVNGTFDTEKFAKAYRAEHASKALMTNFRRAAVANDAAKITEYGTALVDKMGDSAGMMNMIAWTIVDPEGPVTTRDLDLAMRAAVKAADASEHKDAAILDTLARVHFLKGDVAKAIEIQTKAVGLAKDEMKAQLEEVLAEYKAKGK